MPTATVTGALLGLAYAVHADSLRKHPAGVVGCAASVLIGAWLANKIVEWDQKVERRKRWMEDGARKQQIKAPPNVEKP
ncbi:hypothetical protein C2S53_008091 [Perilla frutescens var. hirtella]|uniref:Uncharacterized protein n=1 Tax=Perilla frutescens var. hirtella TaxID=608512 RepID=A0AAD4IW48_PERFH|nr:hypothetical protein C2S53_008091 [Perilla frutescens var. hirtella]